MPPQLSHCISLVTPKSPLLSQTSPRSRIKPILDQKYSIRMMKITKRNLIPILVFILSTASIFRFLKITMITNSSSPTVPQIHHRKCSSTSTCSNNISSPQANTTTLTEKETRFLLNFFSSKVPCNVLIFGLEHEYSNIAALNVKGLTVFLQSNPITTRSTNNNTKVYKITYNTIASEAFKLLKYARENAECTPKVSKCNLVLSNLPRELYETMWDVVIVDGPNGDTPDSPGRMSVIYTASILARRGNKTHVLVHDVDRMIENWFSREFLCEENLVYSKGRFWDFQILGGVGNATKFCTT